MSDISYPIAVSAASRRQRLPDLDRLPAQRSV